MKKEEDKVVSWMRGEIFARQLIFGKLVCWSAELEEGEAGFGYSSRSSESHNSSWIMTFVWLKIVLSQKDCDELFRLCKIPKNQHNGKRKSKKESTASMKLFPASHPIIEPVLQGEAISLQHSEPVFLNSACDYRGAQLEKCRVFLGWQVSSAS